MTPDAMQNLVGLLKDWAKWMHHTSRNGFPSRVPLLATGAGSSTFDELLEQVDAHAMKMVDASIDSLVLVQHAAIMREYGICAVFRYPRDNYLAVLDDAHNQLYLMLKRKGCLT